MPEIIQSPKPSHRFGNYEILSLLGKGGMAEVYRARALSGPHAGWHVAIKRMLPELSSDSEAVALFLGEADLSKLLDHPNIVKVLETGVLNSMYFMVMEMVDGRDLGQILRRCKQREIHLPIDFAVFLAKVLLEALAYAHSATDLNGEPLRIVHCDVSPSNVFISRTGEIKLGDFGIAWARATVRDGKLRGKPYYLSPEVLEGEVTPEADIWAATVTLYELLTLERPFAGKAPSQVFKCIQHRRHIPLRRRRPEASQEIEDIIERQFSINRNERFQSASAFAEALTPHFDETIGNALGIAAVVRGLFGAANDIP